MKCPREAPLPPRTQMLRGCRHHPRSTDGDTEAQRGVGRPSKATGAGGAAAGAGGLAPGGPSSGRAERLAPARLLRDVKGSPSCHDPVGRVLGPSSRRLRLPRSEAGTSPSRPDTPASVRSGHRPPRLRVLTLARASGLPPGTPPAPASVPTRPRPAHPAARSPASSSAQTPLARLSDAEKAVS